MAVEVEDFLSLAKRLSAEESEIAQRSAASRAYYYAYHLCRVIAETNDFPAAPYAAGKGGTHNSLIQSFLHYSDPNDKAKSTAAKCAGYMLIKMRDIRTHADYQLDADFWGERTEEIFEHISRMQAKLNSCF